jgi:ferrous iron transport protein A
MDQQLSLRDLKSYLIQYRQVTLNDLSYHFKQPPELIQAMLQHWIQKGKVVRIHISACQKGCCAGVKDMEIYRWTTEDMSNIPFINNCQAEGKRLSLGDLKVGENGKVLGFNDGEKPYRRKLLAMGLTPGTSFRITRYAPLGDPVEIKIRGFSLSLRRNEANALLVEKV